MKNLKPVFIALTILICVVLAVVFYLQTTQAQVLTSISGRFYKLDVLATNTQLGIASIFPGASINDNGVVAFSGTNGLFTANGINAIRTIRSNSFFDAGVQINNSNHLIARNVIASDSQQFLNRYDTNLPTPPETTIAGVNGVGLNDFADISSSSFGLNNSSQAVFSATDLNNTDRQLVTGLRTTFNLANLSTTFLTIRPVVADNGNVVVRAGNTSTSPIRLYNYALTAPIDIATVGPTTFSSLGQSPGISDDAEVIVFYGIAQPNNSLGTNQGPGVFASIVDNGTRRIIRIAGRLIENVNVQSGNLDGVCDAPELAQCVQGELGFTTANAPITFSSFGADNRIGVVHRSEEPTGIDNDTFIVSFLGTPSSASSAPQYFSNQLGLWTVRVDMKNDGSVIREKPFRATPVIQVGDNLGSASLQVTGISVYDPIALAATYDGYTFLRSQRRPDHRLVFQVSTVNGGTNGSAVVRASYLDSDEDGLPDHWEISGIDFNQDGTIDLALNNLPGDPVLAGGWSRKDVYVEIDYMQGAGRTNRPDYKPDNTGQLNVTILPMQRVRTSFNIAPVGNYGGTGGIVLHTLVDEELPEVAAIEFKNRRPGSQDDFEDFKFGSNGGTAGTPCGLTPTDGHFGTQSDRGTGGTPNPNCNNILGAKRLVFRYCIFAQRFSDNGAPTDFGGIAEIAGNDFVISQSVQDPGQNDDWGDVARDAFTLWGPSVTSFDEEFADMQAGVFMHELGHTLGLYHGGNLPLVNCKPNYLSVMSYSRQRNQTGYAAGVAGIAPGTRSRVNRRLDYSREVLGSLNESSLVESAGIGESSDARTLHGAPPVGNPPFSNPLISNAGGSIDWNFDGSATGTVSVDVNRISSISNCATSASSTEVHAGYNDWNSLRYNFFSSLNFSEGELRIIEDAEDTVADGLNGSMGGVDIDVDGIANIADNCLFAPNTGQSDTNANGIGDACDSLTTILADLSLAISESADPVQINAQFDYVVTIHNDGGSAANSVTFNNQLPANVSFVSTMPSQGNCTGTTSINCNLGTIANGSNATVTIRVSPTTTGRVDNYVDANSQTELDPNVLNNTSSASTTIINSAQTFTISGTVNDGLGAPVSGVSVGYNGTQQGSAVTDGSGNYLITVVAGGIYDLTPSKTGFVFTPPGRSVPYIAINQTVNFTAIALPAVISGTVTYGNALGNPPPPRYVSNAFITGVGSPVVSTITEAPGGTAGQYVLSGFGSGAYTVAPSKTGGVNGGISSFDAARVGQHASGPPYPPLTGNQLVVADVSGNGAITSFDAGMIAKFVAGPPYGPPGIGSTSTWRFVPVSRTYPTISANVTGEDYSGLLMGEVSGNWNNTGARPAGGRNLGSRGPVGAAAVALPNLISGVGRDIVVRVIVQSVAGEDVIAYEFDLRYDPAVIQPVAEPVDVVGTISRKFEIVTNAHEPGLLRVVVYGPMAIGENGVLLNLRFVAVGPRGSVSPLTFERIMFNEGEPGVTVTNGRVELF